jgi:hypothetical protein
MLTPQRLAEFFVRLFEPLQLLPVVRCNGISRLRIIAPRSHRLPTPGTPQPPRQPVNAAGRESSKYQSAPDFLDINILSTTTLNQCQFGV